jgi:hypothetical protein
MSQYVDEKLSLSTPAKRIYRNARCVAIMLLAVLAIACQPSNQTPGQWLRGDAVSELPQDWSFTDKFSEVYVEVTTPYLVPHSVTIWCAHVGGKLFIAARDPQSKNWPGWMDKSRDIRLKIDNKIYEVSAADFSDEVLLGAVKAAYTKKYNLEKPVDGKERHVQYWAIVPRA